jgi:hypothetical protein
MIAAAALGAYHGSCAIEVHHMTAACSRIKAEAASARIRAILPEGMCRRGLAEQRKMNPRFTKGPVQADALTLLHVEDGSSASLNRALTHFRGEGHAYHDSCAIEVSFRAWHVSLLRVDPLHFVLGRKIIPAWRFIRI